MINSFTFKCLKTSITRSLIKMILYLTINRQARQEMRVINRHLRNVVLIFTKYSRFPTNGRKSSPDPLGQRLVDAEAGEGEAALVAAVLARHARRVDAVDPVTLPRRQVHLRIMYTSKYHYQEF